MNVLREVLFWLALGACLTVLLIVLTLYLLDPSSLSGIELINPRRR